MRVSFIVTSYNIETFIGTCLSSLVACTKPGDQVIVVDDGSTDQTVQRIQQALRDLPWPQDVERTPIFLAKNTPGGVGIGANIGLGLARREAVFFVDGDDWLNPDGVHAARSAFVADDCDLMIANYRCFDEVTRSKTPPSDAHFWTQDLGDLVATHEDACDFALGLNAVPWRKFYRRAWMLEHDLRFPEGDFFYEDNPFHWACCLRASKIGFLDVCVAYHRLSRPGQTMADSGHGFAAMFMHYETILQDLDTYDHAEITQERLCQHRRQADIWLATNMAWQFERISPSAMPAYAAAAATTIAGVRRERWRELYMQELGDKEVGYLIGALVEGNAGGLMQAWFPLHLARTCQHLERRIGDLEGKLHGLDPVLQETRDFTLSIKNQIEFETWRTSELK